MFHGTQILADCLLFVPATLVNTVDSLKNVYQKWYNNITTTVGCNTANDSLSCLRTIPYQKLYNSMVGFQFKPYLDGVFLSQPPSVSIQKGEIADVAIIMGSNTDEGTAAFFGPRGTLNNDSDVSAYLSGLGAGLNNQTIEAIMELYPDDPVVGCPFYTGPERFADQGYQYKRGAAITGDYAIHAGRRDYAVKHSTNSSKPIYTYRFDTGSWNWLEYAVTFTAPSFVTHFSEIVYVFDNPDKNVNWIGPYPTYHALAKFLSRSWVSFVHDQNPNNHGLSAKPVWPKYCRSKPQNLVFKEGASYIEADDWRKSQLSYWASIWTQLMT